MMQHIVFCFLLNTVLIFISNDTFKSDQLKYNRVREAYSEKFKIIQSELQTKEISIKTLELYIRIFKLEHEIELWGKNKTDSCFQLIKKFNICRLSGEPGPKRKQGDLQVPEGFYHISAFNPVSNFHLSLCINYPNFSDRILGDKSNPGGNICIHGSCVTIGCIPITDDKIKELYIYAVEACNNSQQRIPISIFPARLTQVNLNILETAYRNRPQNIIFWNNIKPVYDYFEDTHKLPMITFKTDGRYIIRKK